MYDIAGFHKEIAKNNLEAKMIYEVITSVEKKCAR